jgi:hypothetical protein
MKSHLFLFALVIILGLGAAVWAQEKEKAAPAMDPQMQAMMANMEKFGAPGPEHKLLAEMAGTWNVESKMWMDPAAPPHVSKGLSVQKTILGGRFIQYDYEGDAMGMSFSGHGLTGYDRYNKKYVSLWLDTMSTCFYLTEGSCDAEGKVCTETGEWDDYNLGKKVNVKNVSKHVNKDKFIMEMYMVQPDGKEIKTMELTYTRKK